MGVEAPGAVQVSVIGGVAVEAQDVGDGQLLPAVREAFVADAAGFPDRLGGHQDPAELGSALLARPVVTGGHLAFVGYQEEGGASRRQLHLEVAAAGQVAK